MEHPRNLADSLGFGQQPELNRPVKNKPNVSIRIEFTKGYPTP
jgi:hypothetical protein